jgi:hypothetical protein
VGIARDVLQFTHYASIVVVVHASFIKIIQAFSVVIECNASTI